MLSLIAIQILSHSGSLERLVGGASKRLPSQIGSGELGYLMRCLHDRLSAFCPGRPFKPVASDVLASPDLLEAAWEMLSDGHLSVHWSDERSLGYAYQFLCAPLRRASQKEIQSANKSVGLDQLIAFTQLYTPGWVADYLLENTLLPQWSSRSGTGSLTAAELTLIDPACGAGHFLIPAFDLFLRLHAKEGTPPADAAERILEHNLAGVDIDTSALWVVALGLLLKGLKAGASDCARWRGLASVLAPGTGDGPSLLGTLDPSWLGQSRHPLGKRYNAVVTNPPYTGRKLLPRDLKAQLKRLYPDSHQDLCAAFIERGLELVERGGRLGFIGQASLLHLPTYRDLRQRLVEREVLISVVDAGPGVFPLQSGEKVNSALVVVERSSELDCNRVNGTQMSVPSRDPAIFIDLTSSKDKESALRDLAGARPASVPGAIYPCDPHSFKLHPRYAFSYRCPPAVLNIVHSTERLDAHADVRQGLATTDNKRFVRYWWDIDPAHKGSRWFPYVKGAGTVRWYSPILHVVNWADNGAEIKEAVSESYPYLKGKSGWVVKNEQFYFRDGLTFSFVNARALAVRRLPAGCIFDVGGSALFGDDRTLDYLLAYLNSSVITAIARLLNPTINFQVGDIRRLPVIPLPQRVRDELAQLGQECYRLKRDFHRFDSTSLDTVMPHEVLDITRGADIDVVCRTLIGQFGSAAKTLAELESRLNALVLDGLIRLADAGSSGMAAVKRWVDTEAPAAQTAIPFSTPREFGEVLIEFLIRLRLEQRSPGWNEPATCQAPQPITDTPVLLATSDNDELCRGLGLTAASKAWLERHLDSSIVRYLLDRFLPSHAKRFHGNPLYFCVGPPQSQSVLVASSRVIRRSGRRLLEASILDPAAKGILANVADDVENIPDWTGADLLRALRK